MYTRIHEAQRPNYVRRVLYVSCHGPLAHKAQPTGIHIKSINPYKNDQIFTRSEFSWVPVHRAVRKVYARRILVGPRTPCCTQGVCKEDSRGSPYTVLYARCMQGGFWWILDLIHWTPGCFLFLFTRGWILVDPDVCEEDPVQSITDIRVSLVGLTVAMSWLGMSIYSPCTL